MCLVWQRQQQAQPRVGSGRGGSPATTRPPRAAHHHCGASGHHRCVPYLHTPVSFPSLVWHQTVSSPLLNATTFVEVRLHMVAAYRGMPAPCEDVYKRLSRDAFWLGSPVCVRSPAPCPPSTADRSRGWCRPRNRCMQPLPQGILFRATRLRPEPTELAPNERLVHDRQRLGRVLWRGG
jgi:hypothetical protein